jgi:hypothetical protein
MNTQIPLITHWILYLRSPPKERRNLQATTQNQTQRPHTTSTLRLVSPGTQRRSQQMRYRTMCKPQRDSGSSCTTPTVSRARPVILYSVICLRGNGVIRRTRKVIQGDDNGHVGRPCQVSPVPPCPELFCELRGLCRHSYLETGSANEEQRKKSPTTPQGQAIYDDLVSRVTTTATTQPETPSSLRQQTGDIDTLAENDYALTFHIQPLTPASHGVLVGRETIALTPIEGHFTATPHTDTPKKYRKPRSGSDTKQKQSRPKGH